MLARDLRSLSDNPRATGAGHVGRFKTSIIARPAASRTVNRWRIVNLAAREVSFAAIYCAVGEFHVRESSRLYRIKSASRSWFFATCAPRALELSNSSTYPFFFRNRRRAPDGCRFLSLAAASRIRNYGRACFDTQRGW